MKGDIPGFHMMYGSLISIHRLQRKINFFPLSFFSLVCPLLVILAAALGLSRGELAGVKRNVGRMGVYRPLRGEDRWQDEGSQGMDPGIRRKGGAHYCMKSDLESLLRFRLPLASWRGRRARDM